MSNRWDERYQQGEYGDKEPDALLVSNFTGRPPGRALDLACGLGRHAIWLAQRGWSVTAVDYSAVALNTLRRCAQGLPIDIVCADLEAQEFQLGTNEYDLICDCCFLWRPLFPQLLVAVKPGGSFLGIYPMAGQGRTPVNPDYLMQAGELAGIFHGWDILHHAESRRAEILASKPLSARE